MDITFLTDTVLLEDPTPSLWPRRLEIPLKPWYTKEKLGLQYATSRIIFLASHDPIITDTDHINMNLKKYTYEQLANHQRVWEDTSFYIDEFGYNVHVKFYLDEHCIAKDIDLRYEYIPKSIFNFYALSNRRSPLYSRVPEGYYGTISKLDYCPETV